MNARRVSTRYRRFGAFVASLAFAASASACASGGVALPHRPAPSMLTPGSPLLSHSLPDGDAWLRQYVMDGNHAAALDVLRRSSERPRDALLRALQEAVVLHHAGRHDESNRLFEWSEQEADRRWTRSVSRNLGSLVVNDRVLPYMPSAAELAIIPYYRMLNYLAIGSIEGAAVEARKSAAYLSRLRDRGSDACAGFGLVEYVAGHVFAAAGDRNDALVSMRHAERSFAACGSMPPGFAEDLLHTALALGVQEVADSVAERYGVEAMPLAADEVDVIVLVEHGFAAHRAQQDILVPILAREIGDGDDGPSALAVAGLVTARLAHALSAGPGARALWDAPTWNPGTPSYGGSRSEVTQVLRLAWPVMRLEASRAPAARLLVGGQAVAATPLEDVSARLVRDLESQRNAILARMVARGVVKYVVAREAEEKAEKEGGRLLGAVVGLFTSTAGNALEQADTRTWSLLPDQIAVARLRVPAGETTLALEVLDRGGNVNRVVDLGPLHGRAGERVFVSHRVWGPEPGDREHLIDLGSRVYASTPVPDPPVEQFQPERRANRPARRAPGAPSKPTPSVPVGTTKSPPPGSAPPPPVGPPGG
jgi:uncharacterized protein